MPVNSNLKVILVVERVSQVELAARVGISQRAMNAICNGKSDPTLENALRITKEINEMVDKIKYTIHDIWSLG